VVHELVTVDFRNVDRHLSLGRPVGCKGKDGYQGDADARPWHETLLKKSQFSQSDPSIVPILSTAWKWCQYSGAKIGDYDRLAKLAEEQLADQERGTIDD